MAMLSNKAKAAWALAALVGFPAVAGVGLYGLGGYMASTITVPMDHETRKKVLIDDAVLKNTATDFRAQSDACLKQLAQHDLRTTFECAIAVPAPDLATIEQSASAQARIDVERNDRAPGVMKKFSGGLGGLFFFIVMVVYAPDIRKNAQILRQP